MFRNVSGKQRLAGAFEQLSFGADLVNQAGSAFQLSQLDSLGYDGELAAIAFDALQSLLAVATKSGRVVVYAKHGVPKCSWTLRPSQAIKSLTLKAGTSFVVIVDARDTLYVYDLGDLDERGEPRRLVAHSMRSSVNSVEYTPALSHLFLGCQDGTVDTFDIDRLRLSPYRIKNLWVEQDELLRRSGVHGAPSRKRIPPCTDVKSHPLDPNQLLVAYEGGIVLYNLTEQTTIRTYEYLVLPGAPGGHNDQTEGAFLERRPACMCIAWRPDGRMFASGHDDGSIVFWSIEDGDKPILARTVAMEDVNLATSSSLFGDNAQGPGSSMDELREPVFKLAWSSFNDSSSTLLDRFSGSTAQQAALDPAASGSLLTVLGGLRADEPKGLYVLHLPPFSAPGLLSGSNPAGLKAAYRASVQSSYKSVMPTDTSPEDFVFVTSNPYYGQSSDPNAVVVLTSADAELPRISPHTERGFVAYAFPPATLTGPVELSLPAEMHLCGNQAVLLAEAVTLPTFIHKRLKGDAQKKQLPITGGEGKTVLRSAIPNTRSGLTHHAVLTVHVDMSVRIWDYTTTTPELLDTFSVRDALSDDQLMVYLEGKLWIEKISPAWETSEIAIALSTGHVFLYRFDYAKASAVIEQQRQETVEHYNTPLARVETSRLESEMAALTASISIGGRAKSPGLFGRKKSTVKSKDRSASSASQTLPTFEVDVFDISGQADWSKDGFKPVFALTAPKIRDKQITACSMSEAGVLAVAWNERLAVVDLRGPELLYSEGSDRPENGGISTLTWAVCAEGDNSERHPRLIAGYNSGLSRCFTLSYTLETWIVNTAFSTFEHTSLQSPLIMFAMDPFGNPLPLNGSTMEASLKAHERAPMSYQSASGLNTLLVAVSTSSLNIKANIDGERLLRKDFTPHKAVAAQLVQKYGMPVLAVLLTDGYCHILSLPKAEVIARLRINYDRAKPSISTDGRIMQMLSPSLFEISTIFTDQAVHRSVCKYNDSSILLPPPPTSSAVAAAASTAVSYISSWFGSDAAKAVAPTNLDDMLGGPGRPPPRVKPVTIAPAPATVVAGTSAPPARPSRNRPAPAAPPAASGSGPLAAAANRARNPHIENVEVEYNAFGMPKKRHELVDALDERGERLSYVNEQLDKASTASADFVNQARRMAMMQGGKAAVLGAGKGAMAGIGKMLG